MNKSCARCNKTVYPIEELKCLDKTWHKTCFKCHECGMTLNMKTYKGFNKLPYCEAHIPKAKATAIADTPELKRIAENTKIQSNVKYHADFEKQKGKFTQVADDPETLRIKQNTKIISNVAYHGDLEKKAAMERQRGTGEIYESRDNESEYFSETLAAEQFSQYQSNQQQSSQQPLQSPISNTHQHPTTTTTTITPQTQQQSSSSSTNKHQNSQTKQQQPQPQHGTQSSQLYAQNNSQNYSATSVGSHYDQQQQQQQQQQQNSHNNQSMHHHQQQMQSSYHKQQQQTAKHITPVSSTTQAYSAHPSSNQQSNYVSAQTYQQQQQQPQQQQQQNNYTHIRSSILQNSHHPSGANLPSVQQIAYYDQYDNYARPTSQNVYNNNSAVAGVAGGNLYNSGSQHHHQQQQQQQQSQQHNFAYTSSQQQQGNNGPNQVYNSSHYTQMNYNNSTTHHHAGMGVTGDGSNGSILSGVGIIGGGSGIGKIADYDPLTDGPRNIPNTQRQSATLIYSSDRGAVNKNVNPKRIGSVADIDPANGVYGSLTEHNNIQNQYYQQQQQQQQQQHHHQQNQMRQTHHQHHHHHQQQQNQSQKHNLRVYRALYDYEAQDTDEVSFSEGDLIFELESIDSGWMTGKVERTGKTGMLPANYVEPAGTCQ